MPNIDIRISSLSDNTINIRETSGLRILKYFLEQGYKTIYITGIDFYQGEYNYLNVKNAKMTNLHTRIMKGNHLGLGAYDKCATHTLESDTDYLKDLLAQYLDVQITATSLPPSNHNNLAIV